MSKINVTKLATAIAELINVAIGGSNDDAGDDAETTSTKTESKGRGRPAGSTNKAKAETKAAPKGKGKAKDEDEDDGLGDDEDDGLGDDDDLGLDDAEEEVTQEDVVNAFKALKASKGVEKCREVLAKIDETNVLTIPAKKYGEALKEINRAASKK